MTSQDIWESTKPSSMFEVLFLASLEERCVPVQVKLAIHVKMEESQISV